ncbi:DUF998 domain-containing protein [Yinghuangia soli]|uniref:DUF998 domain-containing protein n=1 Tax=Yinghuangia soli TaxID=2908204 RepID=A0AA41Q2M3_9ACTN|nr:DUF998 domain-containing protein [Yinghuangia soli]MCF2529284.1 DUF998 domain-containing protein [Yinghuangia soli]
MATTQLPAPAAAASGAARRAAAGPRFGTPASLACAVVAGPLWVAVSAAQAAAREGFEPTRHPLSALATGSLGWVQIANFVVAGVLIAAGATGLRRALAGAVGGVWVPRLARTAGFGMIAAGLLTMDPADGFPVGTRDGPPETLSWHAIGHMAAGSVTFAALIAAGFVLGRHYARQGRRGLAAASRTAATALLVGNAWAMSGASGGALVLAVGASSMLIWLAAAAARLRRTA